jgi:flagellar FliL protein
VAKTPTETKPADKSAPAQPAPAKRGKLMLVALLVVTLLGGGGGGAWWWINRDAGTAEAAKPASTKPPVFMNLEPFTVNLAEEDGEHYLQMSVTYHVADEKAVETLKAYLPVIRNRILLLLSSKKPSDLATPAGKAKLVDELATAVRDSIPGSAPDRGIVQAYLGAFVIQ